MTAHIIMTTRTHRDAKKEVWMGRPFGLGREEMFRTRLVAAGPRREPQASFETRFYWVCSGGWAILDLTSLSVGGDPEEILRLGTRLLNRRHSAVHTRTCSDWRRMTLARWDMYAWGILRKIHGPDDRVKLEERAST